MNNGGVIVLNLAARYAAAFGAVAVSNSINSKVIYQQENKFKIDTYSAESSDDELTIFKYNGTSLKFSEMLTDENSSVYAPPLFIDFYREKALIETEVSGSNTIVVERWGTRSWEIDIKGILVDVTNRKYPKDKIEELTQFFNHNNIVETIGEQFYDKKIDSMYLTSISVNPVEGFPDTIQFQITATSIKSVNYTLLNPL